MKLSEHTRALDALATLAESVGMADAALLDGVTPVDADALPAPFDRLLLHRGHMTSRLETFYGRAVRLDVLSQRRRGDTYARHITLTMVDSSTVVEVGIVRINLAVASPDVREEIESKAAPLGDILIRHNVMRTIEPHWFLHCSPGAPLVARFALTASSPAYGRLGTIYCDDAPAIELLEIVADRRSPSDAEPD